MRTEYDEMYVLESWVMSLALVDGNGNIMFPDHEGADGYGADSAEFLYPYLENIPDELWMAPVDEEDGTVDMSRAVLVKPANE